MSQTPEEMLESLLNNPDAINQLGNILGAMGGESAGESESSQSAASSIFDNPEIIFKIGQILGSMSESDNETRLIEALKPYLSEKRSETADKAIKIMKLSKMAPLFGDMNIF